MRACAALVALVALALLVPAGGVAHGQHVVAATATATLGGSAAGECPLLDGPFEISDCSGFRYVDFAWSSDCSAPDDATRSSSWDVTFRAGLFENDLFDLDGTPALGAAAGDAGGDHMPVHGAVRLIAKPGRLVEADLRARCTHEPPGAEAVSRSARSRTPLVLVPPAIRLGSSVPLRGGSTVQDLGHPHGRHAPNANLRRLRRGRRYRIWYQPYVDRMLVIEKRLRIHVHGAGVDRSEIVTRFQREVIGPYVVVRPRRAGILRLWLSLDGVRGADEIRLRIRR
jgi:hypothetical protein